MASPSSTEIRPDCFCISSRAPATAPIPLYIEASTFWFSANIFAIALTSFWRALLVSETAATFLRTDAGVGSLAFLVPAFAAMGYPPYRDDKKVGQAPKDYPLTVSGPCSSSWMVFSARPLGDSRKPLVQYSHWIMLTVQYRTIYVAGYWQITGAVRYPRSISSSVLGRPAHHPARGHARARIWVLVTVFNQPD
ncbi:hypothetical protein IBTHAUMO2_490004 [Nitrosopumilaceae archaeon]|nr:hypothetical protein IBTHAUMO2_490004 [Nitrosopumilaceae archaeon]